MPAAGRALASGGDDEAFEAVLIVWRREQAVKIQRQLLQRPSVSAARRIERLTAAYADARTEAATSQWQAMLDDELFETQPIAVVEFVRIKDDAGALDAYTAYADALSAAFAAAGGEMMSVSDILMPGVGGGRKSALRREQRLSDEAIRWLAYDDYRVTPSLGEDATP